MISTIYSTIEPQEPLLGHVKTQSEAADCHLPTLMKSPIAADATKTPTIVAESGTAPSFDI